MKLKKLFALALAVCMMALAVPAAFAAGLTLDYGTTPTTPVVEEPIQRYSTYADYPVMPLADDSVGDDSLKLFKTVTYDKANDVANIKLEAYTVGSAVTKPVPTDIVLVLDESKSMESTTYKYTKLSVTNTSQLTKGTTYYILQNGSYSALSYCDDASVINFLHPHGWWTGFHFTLFGVNLHWGSYISGSDISNYEVYIRENSSQSKIDTLKAAAKTFITKIAEDAAPAPTGNDVDHKVAVIRFSDTAADKTEGLLDIRTNYSKIESAINGLSLQTGDANIANALVQAKATLGDPVDGRNRVVVVFTNVGDYDTDTISTTLFDSAIATAKSIKVNTQTNQIVPNTFIYTVGLMDQADPSLDVTSSDANQAAGQKEVQINRLMQYVSSNYSYAESLTVPGTKTGSVYYVAASNSASYESIFTSILTKVQELQSSSEIGLNATAKLIDGIMPQFVAPNKDDISVKTYNCESYNEKTGVATWYDTDKGNTGITVDVNNGNVIVTGFNYNNYFLTGEAKNNNTDAPHGRKIVIEFSVARQPDFLGGSDLYTNTDVSGIYASNETTVFGIFNRPTVDVPVKDVTPTVQNQTIYLSNTADLTSLMTGFDTQGRIDGTNNESVVLTYALKDSENNTVATYEIPMGETSGEWDTPLTAVSGITSCTPYTLTCTVNGGMYDDGTENKAETKQVATVHVVKPTITNSDTTVYLSNSIDLNTQMQEAAVWTCSHSGVSLPVMEESVRSAPEVDYAFVGVSNETAYAPDACADITVSATVGENNTPFALSDNSFKVHVLTPTVVAEEKTIWQSESVTSTATVTGWNCACTDVTHTMHKNSAKPDETIEMPSVTPEDCTKYTATYTVGDTDFTADYWVHVLTADLSMSDPSIYLSQTVTFDDHDTVTWETQCEHGKRLTSDAPTASAVVDRKASAAPKTCMAYEADLKIGRTVYTKAVPFTVHVVCPAVTATDATIKLGNKAPETGHVDWEITSGKFICECDKYHNANAMPDTKPVLSVQHTGAEYPTACSNNGHKATALIDGVLWADYCVNYTVHVQTPVVTGKTDTIYQGQEYDLTSTVTWKKCAHDKALTNESEQDPAATTTYQIKNLEGSFIDAGTKANYDACSDYKVTYQPTNVPNSFTGEFTVHVLIPTFTVETQDLWADLGTNVTLFTAATTDVDAVKSVGVKSWEYAGTCSEGHRDEHPTDAPEVPVTKVVFNEGEAATIKEQDVSVTANAVTYTVNGKTYTAGNDRLTGNLTAKLHANTFVLKVKNTSAQNGIFTLKQGNTELYDVAVPGNSDTTTIAGLYCTKTYNLAETTGNAWSWRYNTAVKSNEAVHAKPGVVATENCNAVVEVTVNYGDTQDNAKWLADEDCVVNKATTQATITNPALSVKKKDEEVTNA